MNADIEEYYHQEKQIKALQEQLRLCQIDNNLAVAEAAQYREALDAVVHVMTVVKRPPIFKCEMARVIAQHTLSRDAFDAQEYLADAAKNAPELNEKIKEALSGSAEPEPKTEEEDG